MSELRPVRATDVEAVCAFLGENMHRGMTKEQYRPIFQYPWDVERPVMGYLLEDEGRIVGFLGAIYSERPIGGRIERFCNLTNWCVLPEFRNESLKLMFAYLSQRKQTILSLSPSAESQKILRAMKYQLLDTFKLFSVPLAHAWTMFGRGRLLWERNEIEAILDERQTKILEDHARTGCRFLAIQDGYRSCFIVSKKRKKQGLWFTEILYVSDAELLRRYFERVKLHLLLKDRTLLLAVDERLLEGRLPLMLPYRRATYYQSPSLKPREIDNLYSEIAVL